MEEGDCKKSGCWIISPFIFCFALVVSVWVYLAFDVCSNQLDETFVVVDGESNIETQYITMQMPTKYQKAKIVSIFFCIYVLFKFFWYLCPFHLFFCIHVLFIFFLYLLFTFSFVPVSFIWLEIANTN